MAQLSLARLEPLDGTAARAFDGHFDTSVAALVLNFGEYPFHQSSIGVIRSLGRMHVPVFAVQRNRFIASGTSRYIAGKIVWPTDAQDGELFVEGMAKIAKILDRPTLLVPADDLSAILIAEHADELPSSFVFARPSASLPRNLANKRSLYQLCRRLEIPCPETFFPDSREELIDIAAHIEFPVVVKVTEPWLLRKNVRSTVIVYGRQELIDYFDKSRFTAPALTFMIQKMIPASTSEDWFVHGYCDHQSEPTVVFTGMKLRSYPTFAGPTTLGRSVRNDSLRDQAVALFSAIEYRGIMDLDYRLDKRDGRYNLLDFNPRIGAQFRLFEDDDGIDVVRALHLDLTARGVRAGLQVEGRTFIVEVQDLLASFGHYRRGELRARQWWLSLRGIREGAWCAADDLLPFLFLCLWMLIRTVSRLFSFKWGRMVESPPRLIS